MAEVTDNQITEVHVTHLHGNRWAVRPRFEGRDQLGTCGWCPRPWTVKIVHANTEWDAEERGLRAFQQE